MMTLILSECKKISKNKMYIILLCFLTISLCMYSYLQFTNDPYPVYENGERVLLKTLDGEPLNTIKEVNNYKQKILDSYQGIADEALWNRYCKDYRTYYDTFTKDLDKQKMELVYGTDYEGLFQRLNGGLTQEDFSFFHKNNPYHISYSILQTYDEQTKTGYLTPFYEKQSELYTLNYIYRNNYEASYISITQGSGSPYLEDETDNFSYSQLYHISHPEALNETIKNQTILYTENNQYLEKKANIIDNQIIEHHIRETLQTNPFVFGNTSDMDRFIENLHIFTFFSLLFTAILLADSFSMEHISKIDQIIVPSRVGYIRITVAKIISGFLVSIFAFLLQFICVYIVGLCTLNLDGWNLSILLNEYLTFYTYRDYIFIFLQMLIIATIAVACLTMFLSHITKNRFATIIIVSCFIMMPYFIDFFLPWSILKFLPSFMPELNFYLIADDRHGIPYTLIFQHVVMWKDIVMIFWLLMSSLLIIIMIIKSKRYRVMNK